MYVADVHCLLILFRCSSTMKILGFILFAVLAGSFLLPSLGILLKKMWNSSVFVNDVKAGGGAAYAPPCEFGPFGIILNTYGDCSKPCPMTEVPVQVNYEGEDICCCNWSEESWKNKEFMLEKVPFHTNFIQKSGSACSFAPNHVNMEQWSIRFAAAWYYSVIHHKAYKTTW